MNKNQLYKHGGKSFDYDHAREETEKLEQTYKVQDGDYEALLELTELIDWVLTQPKPRGYTKLLTPYYSDHAFLVPIYWRYSMYAEYGKDYIIKHKWVGHPQKIGERAMHFAIATHTPKRIQKNYHKKTQNSLTRKTRPDIMELARKVLAGEQTHGGDNENRVR